MSARERTADHVLKGPGELVLAAVVARRHYIEGQTKVDIADALQMSRFKVARLLEAARRQGLVRIEIAAPGPIDLDLSARVREAFHLKHAIVVDAPEGDAAVLRGRLGQVAADLLTELVTSEDVLGLAWARSVQSMVSVLSRLPPIPVVQLTGALSSAYETSSSVAGDSSVDIVREVARRFGGPAYLYFAPFLVDGATTALALRRQPEVARAFEKIAEVTIGVVGIGGWAPGQSTLYDAANQHERDALTRAGVCADIAGVFLTADSEPLSTSLNARMIGIDATQLRQVPTMIGIAYGRVKQPAALAALRGGYVNALITNAALAEALLAAAGPPAEAARRGR